MSSVAALLPLTQICFLKSAKAVDNCALRHPTLMRTFLGLTSGPQTTRHFPSFHRAVKQCCSICRFFNSASVTYLSTKYFVLRGQRLMIYQRKNHQIMFRGWKKQYVRFAWQIDMFHNVWLQKRLFTSKYYTWQKYTSAPGLGVSAPPSSTRTQPTKMWHWRQKVEFVMPIFIFPSAL